MGLAVLSSAIVIVLKVVEAFVVKKFVIARFWEIIVG